MKKLIIPFVMALHMAAVTAQEHEKVIASFFREALSDMTAMDNLEYLCREAGGRLDGSAASRRAVEYTRNAMIRAGADSVWLQKVMVPHWVRGKELCAVQSPVNGTRNLNIAALGLSSGTDSTGITAGGIEVHDFEELRQLGRGRVEGKIVFFNRPVDNTLINTFEGYGGRLTNGYTGLPKPLFWERKQLL